MLIAHGPAGYLCACAAERFEPPSFSPSLRRAIFWAFLIGSIFPDLDMFYFYLIDHRQHHHHLYPTHLPFVWLCLYALALGLSVVRKRKDIAWVASAFAASVFLHLLLDTPMGGIAWLYPLSSRLFHLVTVHPTQSWWFLSFVFHWTFLAELLICLGAFLLFLKRNVPDLFR